ncbi:MAG: hypothetical protein HOC09_13980 [Deltaproteobacteria bacterium]|jgi:hypothetical protein|nr:hypothetical protein [Deltaproteobacteria bacterium]
MNVSHIFSEIPKGVFPVFVVSCLVLYLIYRANTKQWIFSTALAAAILINISVLNQNFDILLWATIGAAFSWAITKKNYKGDD